VIFGVLFLLAPGAVAGFLGQPPAPATLIAVLGALLVLHGGHLAYVATRPDPRHWVVAYFSFGDALWVAATLALVLSGTWITAPAGILVALATALVVGLFGVMQWQLRPRALAAG
jgi:hypothetical protein